MRGFRRLPLALKVIELLGLLLALAGLTFSLSHFLRFFSALGLAPLDDLTDSSITSRFLQGLVLLTFACIFPVAAYGERLRRAAPTAVSPPAGQTLRTVALLALLPLTMLALELFAPWTSFVNDLHFGLSILALISIVGWTIYAASRPATVQPANTPSASGDGAPHTSSAGMTGAEVVGTVTADVSGSGGHADMTPPTQSAFPFQSAWWSFDLGKYRPCDGTYCFYPYESIPPIRALDGALDWLGPLDPQTDQQMEIHRNAAETRGKVAEIEAEATRMGLRLPEAFVRLMGSAELQDRIPSCTACTFGLGARIVPCIGAAPGQAYLIRFLNDQQDVLIWYLYLTPQGQERVLVTPYEFGEDAGDDPNALPGDTRTAVIANTVVCAPSFEAFVYRWWLENAIWFKLNEAGGADKLTDEERRYLAHYERQGGGGS